MPDYMVIERHYSWGTMATVYRYGIRTLTVDIYRNGDYQVWTQ